MITRRRMVMALGASALTTAITPSAMAQTTGVPRRIAILSGASVESAGHFIDAFRAALKSLGYSEGRDIVIDIRWAENKLERLPALIQDLLSYKPSIVVTHGSAGVVACQKATSTVPIVFATAGDPVGQGFIQSYRHPGGNITGVAFNEEINKKQYEIVKAALPAASRIATLVNVNNPAQKHHLDDIPRMAKALHFDSILVHATKEEELEAAFQAALKAKAHALIVSPLAPFSGLEKRLIELQFKFRMPSFTGSQDWVPAGGLASYSFPTIENWRRVAALADKILKGASPAEIPVEIPTKYEVAINLQTAKTLGLKIPQGILVRATKVIE